MEEIRILVADDQPEGQKIIEGYINHYFKLYPNIVIHKEGIAYKAIDGIEKGALYDFIFADLEFDTVTDNEKNITGKDILIAAHKAKHLKGARFFTVSGKKGTDKINSLEEDLTDLGISFTSMLKDYPLDKAKNKIKVEHKAWTKYIFSIGIEYKEKSNFLLDIEIADFEKKITVFDSLKTIGYVMSYWICGDHKLPTQSELLSEFQKEFYDLPHIPSEKLFHDVGLFRIKSLSSFYVKFWSEYSHSFLKEILYKANDYLDQLVGIYSIDGVPVVYDTYSLENNHFQDLFSELRAKIQSEKTKPQGALKSCEAEKDMISFMQRLWVRIFSVGAYFLSISECDIYRLFGKKDLDFLPDVNNTKIFERSLWIEGTSESMESFTRNYRKVWDSLCNYEREFLKLWWSKLERETAQKFLKSRNASFIIEYLENSK